MTKNKDGKEIALETVSFLSQVFIAAFTAGATGGNPYVTGSGAFLSQFLGLWGKLKANRVKDFVEEFGNYIRTIDKSFNWENVNSEEFGDFFERLLVKVSSTSSKSKVQRFKKLLVNQLIEPQEIDIAQRYLDLVSDLTDNEIVILEHMLTIESKWHLLHKEESKIVNLLLEEVKEKNKVLKDDPITSTYTDHRLDANNQRKLQEIRKQKTQLEELRKPIVDVSSYSEVEYSINVLHTKWLVKNNRLQLPEKSNLNIFALFEPTQFGMEFMKFLKE